jgi:hypothetical protein
MGVSGQLHAPAALFPPRKGPPVPIVQESGWAPELVWTQKLEEKYLASAGDLAASIPRHIFTSVNILCDFVAFLGSDNFQIFTVIAFLGVVKRFNQLNCYY